jgi:hypothetical protein
VTRVLASGLSRRAVLGSAVGLLGTAATASASESGGERPNILCLVSEDNNPYIGAYGDRLAHTPNIDALAARGVLFRNAYSNAPVCAPSRFALLTGIDPRSCSPAQHMRAEAHLPEGFRTNPDCFGRPATSASTTPGPITIATSIRRRLGTSRGVMDIGG